MMYGTQVGGCTQTVVLGAAGVPAAAASNAEVGVAPLPAGLPPACSVGAAVGAVGTMLVAVAVALGWGVALGFTVAVGCAVALACANAVALAGSVAVGCGLLVAGAAVAEAGTSVALGSALGAGGSAVAGAAATAAASTKRSGTAASSLYTCCPSLSRTAKICTVSELQVAGCASAMRGASLPRMLPLCALVAAEGTKLSRARTAVHSVGQTVNRTLP